MTRGLTLLALLAGLVWLAGPVQAGVVFAPDVDTTSGQISTTYTLYSSAHDTTTGASSAPLVDVGQMKSGANYSVFRSLFRFDTSAVPDEAITAATVKFVLASDYSTTDFFIKIVAADDTLTTAYLNGSMFSKFKGRTAGAVAYAPTVLSDSIGTSGKSAGDTLTFTLNAAGIARIAKGGTTQYYIVSGRDMGRVTPADAEHVGLGDDSPYMTITYGAAPASTGRTPYNRVNAFDNAAPFNRAGRF